MSRELYRDPINGKLSGVCAGLANYFGLEVWLVRILVISAALLGGVVDQIGLKTNDAICDSP
ncbi:PspC domain-containing protein, partial [Vibrio splendidus]|uniref:PspC domain-containing protein n=1 Tax=Vibrio splendidus TaxID=29497 RepID=UPI00352CE4B5